MLSHRGPPILICYDGRMLSTTAIDRIVSDTTAATLAGEVARVFSEPTADLDGQAALRIMIVLKRGRGKAVSREGAAINTLIGILDNLQKSGEERFPIIEYATEDELEESDDS